MFGTHRGSVTNYNKCDSIFSRFDIKFESECVYSTSKITLLTYLLYW